MREIPAPDYFEAIRAKTRTVRLRLAGEDREIIRAPLGLHYELLDILYTEAEDDMEKVINYVATATGIPGTAIFEDEIAPAFDALTELNEPTQLPAIVRFQQKGGAKTPPGLEYRGRWVASVVNEIAHHYGWSPVHILALGPEEALLYLQEIVVSAHAEKEYQYNLSDAGTQKNGKKKPFPGLPWSKVPYSRLRKGPPPPPIPEIMRPIGNIIRVDDLVRQQRAG